MCAQQVLSLHTTIGTTTSQCLYFCLRNEVEVAIDSVLESRCSHGKLECLRTSVIDEYGQTTAPANDYVCYFSVEFGK